MSQYVHQENIQKPPRIFWLGMHKVLVQTELARLRSLGYEVFNPPYLSDVADQSANLNWDSNQYSTLPQDVFDKLSAYNFFYNDISDDVAGILNEYFDAVIVTISTTWLAPVVRKYKGKIIYRTYGQHGVLSEELRGQGLLLELSERENFIFMPHADEALHGEQFWLKERAVVVPYCLSDDIFQYAGQWEGSDSIDSAEIAVTCPNINNPFFRAHYDFLKENFSENYYRYYGVQLGEIDDSQVVGTLPREKQIEFFKRSAGYLYTYSDIRVCYLPPIEMMVLGGPVLFLEGSLLDSYFEPGAPGRCKTISEAKEKVERLRSGDSEFINSLICSQQAVKNRYDPSFVWPIFDEVMRRCLREHFDSQDWLRRSVNPCIYGVERIYLLHHFPGNPVIFNGVEYTAYDGIPRVMRQVVNALGNRGRTEIWVTARSEQAEGFYGFFKQSAPQGSIVKVLLIDGGAGIEPNLGGEADEKFCPKRFTKNSVKRFVKFLVPERHWPKFAAVLNKFREIRAKFSAPREQIANIFDEYIDEVNRDDSCFGVIVPHYYLFPEALGLCKNIYMYLPDYMPHFFHRSGEFAEVEGWQTEIGRKLADKSKRVFCNSEFTKGYLPDSRLNVSADKISVFYLPVLNSNADEIPSDSRFSSNPISKPFVFYPTQPRANKNLSFLLKVFSELVKRGNDIYLVLTAGALGPDPKAAEVYEKLSVKDRVLLFNSVSDAELSYLYGQASLLCLTSLAEGNFPPQIQEALHYGLPVVASRLGFVTERIPTELLDCLLLCEAGNLDAFVRACEFALNNKDLVLERQEKVLDVLKKYDRHYFDDQVLSLFK